ncbi:MAG: restriction endonuclease subunit S [Bacteroidales bacterium]|nr:restriction endonuclease subunit S [Bacteroidales bacterium]
MNQMDYKRLGDYIREVNVRNRDLKVTNLLGMSISKKFIPSIANTIGTDMSTYKIIKRNQFAYVPVTSRNGEKITIALLDCDDEAIISQAYTVFEIVNPEQLLPEYLMMWFRRPEFDRYARFHSHGSAREVFDWDELCEVRLPIPTIARQREIVAEYETLSRRIRLNEQMIARLEETAQALYRKMFVDGIDKENLPEGWRWGKIEHFCKEMKSGGTPSRSRNDYWDKKDYPWLKSGEVHNNIVFDTEEYISQEGLDNSSAKIISRGTVVMAMYGATAAQVAYLDCETTTNQACCNMICHSKEDAAYLFFHLLANQEDIKKLANGGAQENLSQELIAQQPIILLNDNEKKSMFVLILDNMVVLYKENERLTELQSLLLARMGQ